jgi:hypothetical protein
MVGFWLDLLYVYVAHHISHEPHTTSLVSIAIARPEQNKPKPKKWTKLI